jgi:DHA2 family multidrug resistance protein
MTEAATSSPGVTILPVDMQAPRYKWMVAGIVVLAAATQTFAGNSVNLAIPRLMAAFGTNLAAAQWIATGFLITRTLVIPILGWLGGFVGNRNLFVSCLIGFVIASVGCGLAVNLPMLIVFRLMQGLVIGPMEGLTVVLLVQAFPSRQRGLALGLRAVGSSLGHVVSFTLGGYFIEHVSWRLIFFLGLPSAILAAVLGLLMLPQRRENRGEPVDFPGLMLLGGFLVPLLLAISFGRDSETAMSTLLLLTLAALLGGGLFVTRELLAQFPAVNLRLFRIPAFCLVCSTAFFNNVGLFGAQFMVPIFLQQVMGFTPLQAGTIIVPAIVVSGFSGLISGRLSDIIHPALVVLGALVTLTGVFYTFSGITPLTSVGALIVYIIFYRICIFAINNPLSALNVRVLGNTHIRMGQGLLGVTRNIGAGLGVTVTSVVFERRRVAHQLAMYSMYDDSSSTHATVFSELKRVLRQSGLLGAAADRTALRTIQRQIDIEAIAAGFSESFLFICICFFLAALPMMLILRKQRT